VGDLEVEQYAEAVADGSVPTTNAQASLVLEVLPQCPPRPQCYPGETEYNSVVSPSLKINAGDLNNLNVSAPSANVLVDVLVRGLSAPTQFITIDTVRVVVQSTDGTVVREVDLSSQLKSMELDNPLSPYYTDYFVCRFNNSLMYVPGLRYSAWAVENYPPINQTVCAYVNDPSRDRALFDLSDWYTSTYPLSSGLLKIQVTIQIRDTVLGFLNCYVTSAFTLYFVTQTVPPSPATTVALIIGITLGSVVGVFLILTAAWQTHKAMFTRRRERSSNSSTSQTNTLPRSTQMARRISLQHQ
jgi:hypothetical protein